VQNVKCEGATDADQAVSFKDYKECYWNVTIQVSEKDGKYVEHIIGSGTGKKATYGGLIALALVGIGFGVWKYFYKTQEKDEKDNIED
jgi:hypothetical protein